MKKLYLILILGCSLVLSSGNAAAESCHNITCASLGYKGGTLVNVVNSLGTKVMTSLNADCKNYITCPIAGQWDINTTACVTYRTFTSGSCPTGAQCAMRYKITSCKDGYTLNNDRTKCEADSSSDDGCLTEAEAIAGCTSYKTVSTGCYACCTSEDAGRFCRVSSAKIDDDSTTCAKSSCPTGAVCNSSNVVTGCKSEYTSSKDSKGCITCSVDGYSDIEYACTKCDYKLRMVDSVYVCGITATSGYVKCKNGTPCFTKQEALWVCPPNMGVKVTGSDSSTSTGTGTSTGIGSAIGDAATAAGVCYECCTSLTDTNCTKS